MLYLTYTLQLISLIVILTTDSLNITIAFIFILGFCNPGKNIVGLNYCLEQLPPALKQMGVGAFLTIESGWLIVIAGSYQYVDRSYKTLLYTGLLVSALTLLTVTTQYPESPKYLHTAKKYD